MPVQSVEMPLHWLGTGPTAPWHTSMPATHTVAPAWHGGLSAGGIGIMQATPSPGSLGGLPAGASGGSVSSILPLQLSSLPLHSSATGICFCTHCGTGLPVTHSSRAVHSPRVSTPLPVHGVLRPGTSSTGPLQSLSTMSQISRLLATELTHTL